MDEDEYDDTGPGCNLCFSDRDVDFNDRTPCRPLAIAAGYDTLRDDEGRRVVITPKRYTEGSSRRNSRGVVRRKGSILEKCDSIDNSLKARSDSEKSETY
jgi:hypothetical protein